MSTITVVRKDDIICMASETLTTFGHNKLSETFQVTHEKIYKWGSTLVGQVGLVSIQMMIKDIIANNEEPDLSNQMKIYAYFTKLHNKLKKKYHLNTDDYDEVESSQFDIFVANKHGLFGVYSYREVIEYNKFWASGSGTDFALGAMMAVYDLPEYTALDIATAGIKAGTTFDPNSGGSVITHEIRLEQPCMIQ